MSFLVDSVTITCCNEACGISFAVPTWWDKGKRETHTRFYCPNGHGQSYQAESDVEKITRERDRARQQIARAEEEAAAANRKAERAIREKKRLEKRAAAGTCPCCQRSFSNMTQHMKKQHPEFVDSNVVKLKVRK